MFVFNMNPQPSPVYSVFGEQRMRFLGIWVCLKRRAVVLAGLGARFYGEPAHVTHRRCFCLLYMGCIAPVIFARSRVVFTLKMRS